jgi:membrane protease YdiL (CAAX protease family)
MTGAIFIAVEAGILLGVAYMLTQRLWMSMSFHFARNYTQSGVVSGVDADPGLAKDTIAGPALLTGGRFGLEASVIAALFCTTTDIIRVITAVRCSHVVPPVWKRPA